MYLVKQTFLYIFISAFISKSWIKEWKLWKEEPKPWIREPKVWKEESKCKC